MEAAAPSSGLPPSEQNYANFLVLDLTGGWDTYLKLICDALTHVVALALSLREGSPRIAALGLFVLSDRVECAFSFQYLKTSTRTLLSSLAGLVARDTFVKTGDSLDALLSDLVSYVGAQFNGYYKSRSGPKCRLNVMCFTTRSDCLVKKLEAALLQRFDCEREVHAVNVYQMEPCRLGESFNLGGSRSPLRQQPGSPSWLFVRRLPAEASALEAAFKTVLLPPRSSEALLCLGESADGAAEKDAIKKEFPGDLDSIQCNVREILLPAPDGSSVVRRASLRRLRAVRLVSRDAARESLVRGEPLLLTPQLASEAALAALCRGLLARRSLLLVETDGERYLAVPARGGNCLLLRQLSRPEYLLTTTTGPSDLPVDPELESSVDAALSRLGEPRSSALSVAEPTPGFYDELVRQLNASLAFCEPAAGGFNRGWGNVGRGASRGAARAASSTGSRAAPKTAKVTRFQ